MLIESWYKRPPTRKSSGPSCAKRRPHPIAGSLLRYCADARTPSLPCGGWRLSTGIYMKPTNSGEDNRACEPDADDGNRYSVLRSATEAGGLRALIPISGTRKGHRVAGGHCRDVFIFRKSGYVNAMQWSTTSVLCAVPFPLNWLQTLEPFQCKSLHIRKRRSSLCIRLRRRY